MLFRSQTNWHTNKHNNVVDEHKGAVASRQQDLPEVDQRMAQELDQRMAQELDQRTANHKGDGSRRGPIRTAARPGQPAAAVTSWATRPGQPTAVNLAPVEAGHQLDWSSGGKKKLENGLVALWENIRINYP